MLGALKKIWKKFGTWILAIGAGLGLFVALLLRRRSRSQPSWSEGPTSGISPDEAEKRRDDEGEKLDGDLEAIDEKFDERDERIREKFGGRE